MEKVGGLRTASMFSAGLMAVCLNLRRGDNFSSAIAQRFSRAALMDFWLKNTAWSYGETTPLETRLSWYGSRDRISIIDED